MDNSDKKDIDSNELTKVVGKNIAFKRKKLGLSQKELALKLDITENAIIRMEKGLIAPKMSRIQQLSDILNCPVVSLFLQDESSIEEQALFIADKLKTFPPKIRKSLLDLINTTIEFAEENSKN